MGLHRARPTMNGLLVLSTLAAASAQVILPYGGLAGYPYGYAGYPYAVAKPVVNEVEVPVPVVQYAAIDTGCKNHFGHAVPCFQEGEARRKSSADEEAAEAAPALPLSFPMDSDTPVSDMPTLATTDSDTLDSATPMPLLPPPLLRLRCPSPSTSTCPRSRLSSFPPPARTLSALPFPALKSVATLCL